jgi:hypothetical protein
MFVKYLNNRLTDESHKLELSTSGMVDKWERMHKKVGKAWKRVAFRHGKCLAYS